MSELFPDDAPSLAEPDLAELLRRELARQNARRTRAEGVAALLRQFVALHAYALIPDPTGQVEGTVPVCIECGTRKGRPHGTSRQTLGQPCQIGALLADQTLAAKAGRVIAAATQFIHALDDETVTTATVLALRASLAVAVRDLEEPGGTEGA